MDTIVSRLSVGWRTLGVYVLAYVSAGFVMNEIGKQLAIAEFGHWWQVLTCYGVYLVPCSLLVRHKGLLDQYLWGLAILAPLELLGYALGTSIAHEGNILDAILGPRNFTLAMVVFFAVIPPVGNRGVEALLRFLSQGEVEPALQGAPMEDRRGHTQVS